MYASSVWAPATDLNTVNDILNSTQRGFALKICKGYRTVSLTSALALSGLLPIDLRIQETASLYKIKKGISLDYLPTGKHLEQKVSHLHYPHPSELITTEFELLEDMNPETIESHHITGPQIYTDGSKIEGKTGAALTWWEGGKETTSRTFSLDHFCSVFQAEMFALHKAVEMASFSSETTINIFSDSRSSLELLKNPQPTTALSKEIKQNISKITTQGRKIRLFWLRAHVGTVGNERADELAKLAATTSTPRPDYDKVPLSFVKRMIREESIRKWQDRYETSRTGGVTRKFLSQVNTAYRIVRGNKLTPTQVQALTGHGGIAEYLHRFKLISSPGCECDDNIPETSLHIILDCPRFLTARYDLENQLNITLSETNLPALLENVETRATTLNYIDKIFKTATKRHSTTITPPTQDKSPTATIPPTIGQGPHEPTKPSAHHSTIPELLESGERGAPGLRTRNVVLFMNTNYERLGIGFCNATGQKRVAISPGVALIVKGSTTCTTIKRKRYDALSELEVAGHKSRLIRKNNKTILLLNWNANESPFTRACSLLQRLSEANSTTPRIISVDAMSADFDRGETSDFIGCIKASAKHEIVVYEGRNQDLSFLRPLTRLSSTPLQSITATPPSGSEKLQKKLLEERTRKPQETAKSIMAPLVNTISALIFGKKTPQDPAAGSPILASTSRAENDAMKESNTSTKTQRTRADMGQVEAPSLKKVVTLQDHVANAFLEYTAILRATKTTTIIKCRNILKAFKHQQEGLLKVRLEEAEATIYNNDSSTVIKGKTMTEHMAAYSATAGIVSLDKEETRRSGHVKYCTPENDPIVVTTQDTEIWLADTILERAHQLSERDPPEKWEVPKITWVNGVPGCGKTTWIINNFDPGRDIVVTTTIEAKKDLVERITQRAGADAARKIRTMASTLVNGIKEQDRNQCSRLLVDEALMNHFGEILMLSRIVGASDLLLIGDVNQLPYIDRENIFKITYLHPNCVTNISQQLLCTHRCPMDVAYALNTVYEGIYSSGAVTESLQISPYSGAVIPPSQTNTLYLTFTQAEKKTLMEKGYGKGEGSSTLTIHEAQGKTYDTVLLIKCASKKLQIHDSVPHAVVAISRHRNTLVYYTDDSDDATGNLIRRATTSTAKNIMEYNLKMAMHNRDDSTMEKLAILLNRIKLHGAPVRQALPNMQPQQTGLKS